MSASVSVGSGVDELDVVESTGYVVCVVVSVTVSFSQGLVDRSFPARKNLVLWMPLCDNCLTLPWEVEPAAMAARVERVPCSALDSSGYVVDECDSGLSSSSGESAVISVGGKVVSWGEVEASERYASGCSVDVSSE